MYASGDGADEADPVVTPDPRGSAKAPSPSRRSSSPIARALNVDDPRSGHDRQSYAGRPGDETRSVRGHRVACE